MAKNLYTQAAEAGNSSGFYKLGVLNYTDKSQDPKLVSHLVVDFMQKAAHGGNDKAKDFLSKFGSQFNSKTNGKNAHYLDESRAKDAFNANNVNVSYNPNDF